MAELPPSEQKENWESAGEGLVNGFLNVWLKSDVSKWIQSTVASILSTVVNVALVLVSPIGLAFTRAIGKAQDELSPALSEIAAIGVNQMFDTNLPSSAFEGGIKGKRGNSASDALAEGLIKQLTGTATTLSPDDAAAKRYLGVMVKMALEGWYQGWFFEWITSLVPEINIGQIENYGSLDTKMSEALGLGRLSRRVLGPLVDATIVTPLQWQVNRTYRPTLLSPSTVVRQWTRGRWDWPDVVEELARQGYSPERIDALVNEQRKVLSVADVRQLLQYEYFTQDAALAYLGEAGFDRPDAELALRVEGTKRIEQQNNAVSSAAISAYAQRDIDDAELDATLDAINLPGPERAFAAELARVRRALNVRQLAPAEVEVMVKSGVAAFIDYRDALRRAGYDERSITLKELQLRYELDTKKKLDEHRAELEAERAAEKQRAADERAARLADVAAQRAIARRGSEADLEAAAIRGLIPFARVEEVYRAHYDDDTVAILVDELEAKRQDYLTEQKRRDAAAQRAESRGLSVGQLESAVLEHVLTLDRYRVQLQALGLSAADVDVLARTLEARLKDSDAAKRARAQAQAASAKKPIDLDRFEQLVRRGVRTIAQYQDFVSSLGFTDAAVAGMVELLKLKIADDAKTRDARAQTADASTPAGLTLDELRRAVVLGLTPRDDYERALLDLNYTADKRVLLMAELDEAVTNADAARARRDTADRASGPRAVPLSTLARAVRLGVRPFEEYEAALRAAGYSDADLLLESDLLVAEIAQEKKLPPDEIARLVERVSGELGDA